MISAMASGERLEGGRLTGLSWSHFLNDGAANYLPGILPAVLVSLNLSVTYAGVLMAALLVGQGVQPLTGLLADRIGGRSLILTGLCGSTVGGALIGLLPSPSALIPVLIGIGVCNALFHPQGLVAARHVGGEKTGMAMSIFLVGGEVGRGAWPLLASWVVMFAGLPALWLLGLPALLSLPLVLRTVPVLPPRQGRVSALQLRRHAVPLGIVVLFCILRSVMIYGVVMLVPIMWHQAGGSLAGGASFISVMLLVGIIGNLGGGHLGDRFGRGPVLTASISASAVCLPVFLLLHGMPALIALALLGVAMFATLPLTILVAQDVLPANRSFGSGLALGFSNAMAVLGIVALGPVAAAFGIAAALWCTALCGAAAIPLAVILWWRVI